MTDKQSFRFFSSIRSLAFEKNLMKFTRTYQSSSKEAIAKNMSQKQIVKIL